MLRDAADVPRGSRVTADVLVIGAGAAGITLARALSGTGRKVVVLESGGRRLQDPVQQLGHPESGGEEYPAELAYLRYLGGTTNHWGGWCRALDPWTMVERPWVAPVGWPIGLDDLSPYYQQAAAVVQLPVEPVGWSWGWDYWRTELPALGYQVVLDTERVTGAMWRFSPPTRFGEVYRPELASAPDVDVILHANAMRLDTDPTGRRVTQVPVKSLAGNRFTASAPVVVLATGGIEVPRILLASNRTRARGLGNQRDLVGRYFMDHIEGSVGTVELGAEPTAYLGGVPALFRALWTLTTQAMADEELLGAAFALDPPDLGATPRANRRTRVTPRAVARLQSVTQPAPGGPFVYGLTLRGEPKPSKSSRVVLTSQRDALGMPRAELQYLEAPVDLRSARRSLKIVGAELGRTGLGRARVDVAARYPSRLEVPDIGFHLMGTTRMAADERHGVVDADLKVFGTDNLYVASSSVFPTAGISNPTLTIVALALRLADHLRAGTT
jgi:choline dehydrogenase-like flavoprotein